MCIFKTKKKSVVENSIPFQNLEKDTLPLALWVNQRTDIKVGREITRTEFYIIDAAPQVVKVDYNYSKVLSKEIKNAQYFEFYHNRHNNQEDFLIINPKGWNRIKDFLRFKRLTNPT